MYRFLRAYARTFVTRFHHTIGLILIQHARFHIVMPLLIENVLNHRLGVLIENRADYLNSIIQVARHKIRRTDKIARLPSIIKYIDAWMLKVSVDDTDRLNVL